ncbi:hypothetical protein [Mycolicibacterium mageritense]|uniref:hypothetical protein n=1 Tax=Mycolicibacterium mageritense TaxID=53462 RepID=UPI001E35CBA6|nr:hypothetical protein [Mycolicibacterium mageritense]MCC9186123.1 hypothetical protein [Mycolicibacterium mageritense]
MTERAVADLDRSVTYDAEAQVLSAVFEVKAPTLRQATTLALRLARPLLREKPSAIDGANRKWPELLLEIGQLA